MPQISHARALVYVAVLLVALLLAGRLAFRKGQPAAAQVAPAALRAEPAPVRRLLVHVVGAVRTPGLYRLDDGSRVDDAIRAAGGPKPKADLDAINLAAPVADGQQVISTRRRSRSSTPCRGSVPSPHRRFSTIETRTEPSRPSTSSTQCPGSVPLAWRSSRSWSIFELPRPDPRATPARRRPLHGADRIACAGGAWNRNSAAGGVAGRGSARCS